MRNIKIQSLIWMAPALLLAAGCGPGPEEKDPCDDVACGLNATCSEGACACDTGFAGNADVACQAVDACEGVICGFHATCTAGACQCDVGYEGDAVDGCTAPVACTETSCSGNGECEVANGAIACECDEGYTGATCGQCATGFSKEGDACVANDLCDDLQCSENGSCVVAAGAASCECAQGWAGELCDGCAEGFALIGTECVNKTKTVSCEDVAPDNAGSDVQNVTITYDEDTQEWSAPDECEWECDTGFDNYNDEGACIDTRKVDCTPSEEVENGEISNPLVDISFVDGEWTTPDECKWECDAGFDDYNGAGACVDTATVSCVHGIVGPPANAEITNPEVVINFVDGEWTLPAVCVWDCVEGFAEVDGACVNERVVACEPAADPVPDNAEVTNALVTIHFVDGDWSAADVCEWECVAGFNNYNDEGACIDVATVDCAPSTELDNASVTNPQVEIRFTDGNWTEADACVWACDAGFFEFEGECVVLPTIDACALLTPLVDGFSTDVHAIAGSVTLGAGDITHVLGQVCYSSGTEPLECEPAVYSADNNEFEAQVTFPVGTFEYLYQFSVDGGVDWVACGLNANPAELGVATLVYPSSSDQLAAVRAADPDTSVSLPVEGVYVTAVVDDMGDETTRFFVQATPTGPAVFVEVASTLEMQPEVGDEISFTVLSTTRLDASMVAVSSLTAYELVSAGRHMDDFIQDVADFSDQDALESEVVRFVGYPVSSFVNVGNGYWSAGLAVGAQSVELRVASPVIDDMLEGEPFFFDLIDVAVEKECDFEVVALLWRSGAFPKPTIFGSELELFEPVDMECIAFFGVAGAASTSNTEVQVTFTTEVNEASITDAATQFVFEPAIAVADYELSADGMTVIFTTESQSEGSYTVTVSGVADVDGRELKSNRTSATFGGTCADVPSVVISQVYAGGGNASATFTHDFVELFNRGSSAVSIDGWSLQQQVASGSQNWKKTALEGVIEPGGYFLIKLAGGANGVALPEPNFAGDSGMNLATASGRVALVGEDVLLERDNCDPWGATIVDFYGYGSGAVGGANDNTCFRGSRGTHMTTNANSVRRIEACGVADDNGADFERSTTVVPRTADPANEVDFCANVCE